MTKVFYGVMLAAVVILVLAGVFLWTSVSEDTADIIPAVKVEPPENYEIKETEEGKIVENTNVGLRFRVPEGWTVEKKEVGVDEWVINVLSPDIEFGENGALSEGCGFSAWVEQHEGAANAVRFRINDPEEYSNEIGDEGEYEAIEVDEKRALKMIITKEGWGSVVGIKVPIKDRVIIFDTLFRPQTEERCTKELDQFLDQVEIYQVPTF